MYSLINKHNKAHNKITIQIKNINKITIAYK